MKRKIVAMLLAGGLVLGLCGCGSGGISAEAPAAQEEAGNTSMDVAGEVALEEVEDTAQEEYSTDGLVDMWLSGELTREEIWRMVAYGEIDSEVYEEFLECIPNSQEFDDIQPEEMPENEDIEIDTNMLSLLTAHVVEYEDQDGYTIRETCQLSPIFTEDDMETVYALWETLGNDVSSFPSEDSLYNASYLLREMRDRLNCNDLEYVIGTYALENLTDGFPITSDNPRSYQGALSTKQVSAFDEEHDGNASHFINVRSVSVVMYLDGATYYGEGNSTILSKAKMYSDTWGPCAFVIALPNGSTPNLPDGYRYDKTLILSTGMYFTDEYDPITLKYYTKEVE